MYQKISKRQFLKNSFVTVAAACAWQPLITFAGTEKSSKLRRLNLNGDWQFSEVGKNNWLAGKVPGCVHLDLMEAGKIPDPFYRENEKSVQWVGESNWAYRRTFDVPAEVLKNDKVLLRCEGLDTLATVKVNGKEVGRADNMFRLWEYDVKAVLHNGENTVEITFDSPFPYFKEKQTDQEPAKFVRERAWVRKEQCSFGWDWGPVLASCGIWKNISLETFNEGRIADVLVLQDISDRERARLDVRVDVESVRAPGRNFKGILTVVHDGKTVAREKITISGDTGRTQLEIKNPKLWWPAGLGDQPLYEVQVELLGADGDTIDSASRRIGLRELKVIKAEGSTPLHLEANGISFFSKGANWIPADSFVTRVTPEISRRFVADAAAVNMNTLRFWGGGIYEDDALFDACDEMGICVWMDFKFACTAYPAFDRDFMDNVRLEARDNLQRLRHHPCIAVWCGNNEISMSWWKGPTWAPNRMSDADYDKLFVDLLAEQVKKYAPQAAYVSGSPDCGDTHYWDVWHGGKPFEDYRTQSGFMSEFGFQSFPEPKTVRAFTDESDRASVITSVMNWHQRSGGLDANQKIVGTILNYFRPPRGFEETLWLSQILQGFGIKLGAEYWRQTMPKSMGCIYWQYNDTWPGTTWSSVDYFGRWKALHYFARRFYEPVLVSGLENREAGTADIFVSSDLLKPTKGRLILRATDLSGETLFREQMEVAIPARKSERVKKFDAQDLIKKNGANGFLTWLELEVNGKKASENLLFFALPKELKLLDPALETVVEAKDDGFFVTVKSAKTALWSWLDLENSDAKYSDNFFHVLPDAPQKVFARPEKKSTREQFVSELRVRSLFDLCLPAAGDKS